MASATEAPLFEKFSHGFTCLVRFRGNVPREGAIGMPISGRLALSGASARSKAGSLLSKHQNIHPKILDHEKLDAALPHFSLFFSTVVCPAPAGAEKSY